MLLLRRVLLNTSFYDGLKAIRPVCLGMAYQPIHARGTVYANWNWFTTLATIYLTTVNFGECCVRQAADQSLF